MNNNGHEEVFGERDFWFNPIAQAFVCPASVTLTPQPAESCDDVHVFAADPTECAGCALRKFCIANGYAARQLRITRALPSSDNCNIFHTNDLRAIIREVTARATLAHLIGKSTAIGRVKEQTIRASRGNATVRIYAESGSGKELVARSTHYHSDRANQPFIVINCAATPASLIDDALVGHDPGAFDGARTLRRGAFERANKGTLFIDEVAEIPSDVQPKLLRVLEEGILERLGGTEVKVDVRIICATNKNLEDMVRTGRFDEGLYHRLNGLRLTLPPLRGRSEDILPTAEYFLSLLPGHGGRSWVLTKAAQDALQKYDWPGNVRDLRNAVEYAVTVAPSHEITPADLPDDVTTSQVQGLHSTGQAEQVVQGVLPVHNDQGQGALADGSNGNESITSTIGKVDGCGTTSGTPCQSTGVRLGDITRNFVSDVLDWMSKSKKPCPSAHDVIDRVQHEFAVQGLARFLTTTKVQKVIRVSRGSQKEWRKRQFLEEGKPEDRESFPSK